MKILRQKEYSSDTKNILVGGLGGASIGGMAGSYLGGKKIKPLKQKDIDEIRRKSEEDIVALKKARENAKSGKSLTSGVNNFEVDVIDEFQAEKDATLEDTIREIDNTIKRKEDIIKNPGKYYNKGSYNKEGAILGGTVGGTAGALLVNKLLKKRL